jgi:hypothetical protein
VLVPDVPAAAIAAPLLLIIEARPALVNACCAPGRACSDSKVRALRPNAIDRHSYRMHPIATTATQCSLAQKFQLLVKLAGNCSLMPVKA